MKCPLCGNEHELLEPSFRRPDAIVAMQLAQRENSVTESDDFCTVRAGNGNEIPRFFLRTVLPVELVDADENTGWGLWVEVTEKDARRAWDLWDSPEQEKEPPFEGCVANQVAGYPDTEGLPVQVQLTGPTTRPRAWFPPGVDHPFVNECRAGVNTKRVLEWLVGKACPK